MPCHVAPAMCNIVATSASCSVMETAPLRNADDQLVVSQLAEPCTTNVSISKNSCQLLGPVDVEDLAMYFDFPADSNKPPSTANRTIYSRKFRYGQGARIDQLRQNHFKTGSACDLTPYDPQPCYLGLDDPESNNSMRSSGAAQPSDLDYCHMENSSLRFGDLRPSELAIPGEPGSIDLQSYDSEFGNARSYGVRACDLRFDNPRARGSRPCETMEVVRQLGRDDNPGKNDPRQSDPWSGNWSCNDCPELLNFCSEERWLQCPASDRCPLYDTTYVHSSAPLPPCMYDENLRATVYHGNDNWHYGYVENEQLLEDYLSNEKRKERSRDAARCRRSKETDIFAELAAVLPITPEQTAHLDKASIMRLAIAYLKIRAVVDSTSMKKSESPSADVDKLFPKALNGFILVLSSDGNMVYLSENVNDYLGISQMDMMGQSVYEYSHPCDHDELRECLSLKPTEKRICSFFLRLKCTLTSKGRKVNLKSASYKVIHCTGRLTNIYDANSSPMEIDNEEGSKEDELEYDRGASLVLVGCPIPHPSNIEVPLGRHTFLSKHSLSMKFTYADEKLAEYLGWNNEELMGQSVFEFYHALDNLALDKCFKCLFSKGQCETVAYRFLGKAGGYAWVVTQATLIHCSKQQKPISVVCVNYILSGVEHENEVYSERQLAARDSELVKSEKSLPALVPIDGPADSIQHAVLDDNEEDETIADAIAEPVIDDESKNDDPIPRPLVVTASIFCSANGNDHKDGSQKDTAFPSPVQDEKTFAGIQALKESLEESIKESLKENSAPVEGQRQNCGRPSLAKTPFIFQGKSAIVPDSADHSGQRNRSQTTTRHLFASPTSQQQQLQQQLSCRPPPQTATESIFAPRTEDMNKGFLTFSEDQPGLTMLKDEPDDLTHLAPTAGDVCVPLEDTPFLSDMLDEFILGSDNYCPLLSPGDEAMTPELRPATGFSDSLKDSDLVDTTRSRDAADRLADSDPFIYGDSPESPCDIHPSTVSPSLSKCRQSSERSVDSLGSPTRGSGGDGLSEDEMLMLGINDSIGDDELTLRAPYIPMSDQDEALQMLISDDTVMWGSPSQPSDKASRWLIDDREQRGSESSLAQLLRTEQVAARRYNDHGGGLVNPAQVFGQIPRKGATFEFERWPPNQQRTNRPSKRIHALCAGSNSEHKRLKCADSSLERDVVLTLSPGDASLTRQQRLPLTMPHRKSTSLGSSCDSSQLLRRLVLQTPGKVASHTYDSSASSSDGFSDECRRDAPEDTRMLDDIIDFAEAEDDRGGGGGGEHRRRSDGDNDFLDKIDASRRNPSGVGSSVLMNLLVSGCDEALLDSRNVPILLSKNLTSPLSINVDNQTVPQRVDTGSAVSLDHLNSSTRKHMIKSFTGVANTTVSSVTSAMPTPDSFDYDVGESTAGLLQISSDLLGSLLDRSLM